MMVQRTKSMKSKLKKPIFFIAVLFFATVILGCAAGGDTSEYTVKVILTETENLTVKSENPVYVKAGEDAVFEVDIPEDMKIDAITEGASYEDGKIIIRGVIFPETVNVKVRKKLKCTYSFMSTEGGTVESSLKKGSYEEDTPVTVKAKPRKGIVFIGWSFGKPISAGGNLVSIDSEYTFMLEKNTTVYANYLSKNESLIIYHANGGVTSDGGDVFYDVISDDYHFYPNTLSEEDVFERDGYILYGYNTKADGTGKYYGCGWNVVPENNGNLEELWCMWAEVSPESDFEYENSGKGVKITKYKGNASVIVVPEKLGGKKVTSIGSKAFDGCTAEKIILSKYITDVSNSAFNNCKFKTLYMFDGIVKIRDESFRDCDEFSTLIVNACQSPKYQKSNHGTYCIKFERLVYAHQNGLKKLVFFGGSNATYGILSEQLEKGLNGEYYIIDYGQHYETCGMFFLDLASNFVSEGDIVILCPEPNEWQMGTNKWSSIMWQFFEGAYEQLQYIDIRDYKQVFNSFSEFNNTRQFMQETTYLDYWNGINRYGDNDWFKPGQYDGFMGSQGTYGLDTKVINADNLNYALDKILERGAKTYMSFSSINVKGLTERGQTEKQQATYVSYIDKNLHVTRISEIADYIFPGRYMYDTNFHLSTEGTKLRTERLINDIKAQLAKEASR